MLELRVVAEKRSWIRHHIHIQATLVPRGPPLEGESVLDRVDNNTSIHICHYSHSPRCDPALSMGQALIAQNTSLFVPLATILTCVPLRGTPSFPPVWQSFSSIISPMYPSQISAILVPIHRCVDLLVFAAPVPPSLTLVAPVIASSVFPNPIVDSLAYATPIPPNPIADSLAYAAPIPPNPDVNARSPSQYSRPRTRRIGGRCARPWTS